jgi:hypothetical protein
MRVYWPVPFEIALLETALFRTERFVVALFEATKPVGWPAMARPQYRPAERAQSFQEPFPRPPRTAEGRAVGRLGRETAKKLRDLWLQGLSSRALPRSESMQAESRPGRDASKKLRDSYLQVLSSRSLPRSESMQAESRPSRETSKKLRDS